MGLVQVRVDDSTTEWLYSRARARMRPESAGLRARDELLLWRAHLAAELARLRLTLAEANMIASTQGGVLTDDVVGLPVAMAVMELRQMQPQSADEWGVNLADLADRLVAAGPTANHALVDACQRWWAAGGDTTPAGWRSVGLQVAP